MFASRVAAAGTSGDTDTLRARQAIADDFRGLRDVSSVVQRVSAPGRDKVIRAAIDAERDEDRREENMLRDAASMTSRLSSDDRLTALTQLRHLWQKLSAQAKNPVDSTERRMARRLMAALSADGTTDADYAKIIAEYRIERSLRLCRTMNPYVAGAALYTFVGF
jgi:hypothetical protein